MFNSILNIVFIAIFVLISKLFIFFLFQAGDEYFEEDDDDITKPSFELGITDQDLSKPETPKEPERLYPTAPNLDESDDSTASAHSTSVWFSNNCTGAFI